MADVAGRGRIGSTGLAGDTLDTEHFYEEIEQGAEFQELEKTKIRFIVPATIFFVVYYFALPILVGYAPDFMDTRVLGNISIGYLFALSQFIMAWVIAFWYLNKAAKVFDVLIAKIVEQATRLRSRKGV